jgi:hypothetical protein
MVRVKTAAAIFPTFNFPTFQYAKPRHQFKFGNVSAGSGDMIRFIGAAIALAGASFSASDGYATSASGLRQPPAASAALITNCYRKAEWIVPRMRGRSAWVVRHADHCVRSGGLL